MKEFTINDNYLLSILNFKATEKGKNIEYIKSIVNPRITINNRIFEIQNPVSFESKNLAIVFNKCEFKGLSGLKFHKYEGESIVFKDCIFDTVVDLDMVSSKMDFESCVFETIFRISELNTSKQIRFTSCVFHGWSFLSNPIQSGSISFLNNKFEEALILIGDFDKGIYFTNNEFFKDLVFGNEIEAVPVTYEKLNSFSHIVFQSGKFYEKIIFNRVSYKEEFRMSNSEVEINQIEIRESVFDDIFVLANVNIKEIIIYGGKFNSSFITRNSNISEIKIKGGHFDNILIQEGFLNNLFIEGKILTEYPDLSEYFLRIGLLEISQTAPIRIFAKGNYNKNFDFHIEELSFVESTFNKNSICQIYNIEIHVITFETFVNLGTIVFSGIVLSNDPFFDKMDKFLLYLVNSDLGNLSFLDCVLKEGKESILYFKSSRLLNAYFSNDILLKNAIFIKDKKSDKKIEIINDRQESLKQEEEYYNQVRKLYENKSDIITSLEYRGKSFNTRRKWLIGRLKLDLEEGFRSICKADFWSNLSNYVILSLNNISNKHGVSWERALIVLILFTGSSYSFYCYLSGLRLGSWTNPVEKEYFYHILSYIGDFLIPLKKTDTYLNFYPESSNVNYPKVRLFALGSQIVIAYLVYQLIQAFRRLGKK